MTAYPDRTIDNLPSDYLAAIGKVCVQWSMLEQTVERALHKFGGMSNDDWRSLVVTAHMTWPMRMDILTALVDGLKDDHPHLAAYTTEVKPAIAKAQHARNRIVHAFWGYDPETSTARILSLTARGKLKTSIEPVTVADIEAVADDIGLAAMLLWKCVINRL